MSPERGELTMCEIGKKMYLRRKELGLTLEEVGDAVGVGKSTVRRWENGMIKNMGRDKIAALARVLKMSPVEFVPGDDEQPRLSPEDLHMIEAMHQNPQLRALFNIQMNLKQHSLDAVTAIVKEIAKERGDE